jgi:thermitase
MMYRLGRVIIYVGIVCVLALAVDPAVAMSRKPPEPAYVPGQVVVKFQESVSRERIEQIVAAENGTVEKVLARSGLHLVRLEQGQDVMDAVASFGDYPEVQYAEPNFKVELLEGR